MLSAMFGSHGTDDWMRERSGLKCAMKEGGEKAIEQCEWAETMIDR